MAVSTLRLIRTKEKYKNFIGKYILKNTGIGKNSAFQKELKHGRKCNMETRCN